METSGRTRPHALPAPRSRPAHQVVRLPTARELEVLQLVADGLGSGEIAKRLWLSEETVKTHVASLLEKLGASSRANAVAIAIRHGLIE